MHDCPGCAAPLHGHEITCPRCGTKQPPSKAQFEPSKFTEESKGNPILIAVIVVVILGALACAAQNSWIGQVINRPPEAPNPMANVSPPQARQMIEKAIDQKVAGLGAKATYKWTAGGAPADVMANTPIELTVETTLSDPNRRKEIVDDEIKKLMDPANVNTITLIESKSHSTATYSLAPPPSIPGGSEGEGENSNQ